MNKFLAVGLAAAAVVVIAIIAFNLLPGSPVPGGEPSVSPEPSAAEPSPSAAADLPVGSSYELSSDPPIFATIPAPGWWVNDEPVLAKDGNWDPPNGAFLFGAWVGPPLIPSDPCQFLSTMPDTPASTVDEIVAALASQATRDASAPVDITVDGHSGKSIMLQVPDDIAYSDGEFTDCDQGNFCTLAYEDGAECSMHNKSPDQVQEVWILDVDGEIVFMNGQYYAETPPDDIEEVRAILGSMTFPE